MKQVLSFLRSNTAGLIFIALGLTGGYLYYLSLIHISEPTRH